MDLRLGLVRELLRGPQHGSTDPVHVVADVSIGVFNKVIEKCVISKFFSCDCESNNRLLIWIDLN